MKILLMSILMLPFYSFNSISDLKGNEDIASCSTHVEVDCNGDGDPDYEGVVDCKYAEDLGDQFEDSCS
jgi:hypothetical protein